MVCVDRILKVAPSPGWARDRVNKRAASDNTTLTTSRSWSIQCDSVNINKATEIGERCTIHHQSRATCRCLLCTYCYFMSGSASCISTSLPLSIHHASSTTQKRAMWLPKRSTYHTTARFPTQQRMKIVRMAARCECP